MLRCKTEPLSNEQTHEYVADRLKTAGADGEPIFTAEAVNAIYLYSAGIPRVVNLICEHSLVNAFVDRERPIQPKTVEAVAREFQLDEVEPIAADSPSRMGTDVYNSEAFLQNLGEALSRFRFSPSSSRERK
jgi:hypothetical protein